VLILYQANAGTASWYVMVHALLKSCPCCLAIYPTGAASSICHVDQSTGVPYINLLQLANVLRVRGGQTSRAGRNCFFTLRTQIVYLNLARVAEWQLSNAGQINVCTPRVTVITKTCVLGGPEPYIHTVDDRMYGDFPV